MLIFVALIYFMLMVGCLLHYLVVLSGVIMQTVCRNSTVSEVNITTFEQCFAGDNIKQHGCNWEIP